MSQEKPVGTSLDKPSAKQRSYVCPPNFIRLSHKCYFFSKEKLTFHDAFFKCRSLHSNLAIIKNSNQDKHIKKTLSSRTVEPLERWLGGRFDWQKKQWQWAASGKPLTYNGFDSSFNQTQESLQWQCITIDPAFQYRWNSRSCYQERNYICQKKLRTIDNNKSRKRLLEQYESKKLNEIPIPDISNDVLLNPPVNPPSSQPHSSDKSDPFHIEIYPLNSHTVPDRKRKIKPIKPIKNKKKKNRTAAALKVLNDANGPIDDGNEPLLAMNDSPYRSRRNKAKDDDTRQRKGEMFYSTYKENGVKKHPLHPRPIVEEYNFDKTA
ncbi:hypothetical protein HUJ04_003008 [Dendroctonus ponderosae]|nr:hypothetical protein HUJ04_003008 [Dendroctonus ponderosae]